MGRYLMGADFAEATPLQAGLETFVNFKKGDFIGRQALLEQKSQGVPNRLVMLEVDAGEADAYGDECIWHDDQPVGWVTSGGWGHRTEKSLALGYVRADLALPGTLLNVEILEERKAAIVVKPPCYDPKNERLRA